MIPTPPHPTPTPTPDKKGKYVKQPAIASPPINGSVHSRSAYG